MFLHRIHLNQRCREVRRDLADPYQLHSTLCRAFSAPTSKCPEGEFLWRLEPETDAFGRPRLLVQSRSLTDWTGVGVEGWVASVDAAIDLNHRLKLDGMSRGQRFRFRLRANPCVSRQGKRIGLLRLVEQENWLTKKGELHGFAVPQLCQADLWDAERERLDVRVSQEQMIRGRQHSGNPISVFSVLYDGVLTVTDPDAFRSALQKGIGHGKVMGLGLISVVPVN